MLKRSPVFKPILQVNPHFAKVYNALMTHDRYAAFAYNGVLSYKLEDTRCVVGSDKPGGPLVTQLLLFPFQVTMPSTNVFGTLHGGMLMTMVDMCTSFHIAERLLPGFPGHVSVNLSTNFITAAKRDDRVVAACRVDKMGKRLVYTSIDFYLDSAPNTTRLNSPITTTTTTVAATTSESGSSSGTTAADASTTTPSDLDVANSILSEYTTVAKGKHVKSILHKINLSAPN